MESGLQVSNFYDNVSSPLENVEQQDIQGVTSEEESIEAVVYVCTQTRGAQTFRAVPGTYTCREYGLYMTAKQEIEKLGNIARKSVVVKEIQHLFDSRSWRRVRLSTTPKEEKKV